MYNTVTSASGVLLGLILAILIFSTAVALYFSVTITPEVVEESVYLTFVAGKLELAAVYIGLFLYCYLCPHFVSTLFINKGNREKFIAAVANYIDTRS